jgi:hypothetical protein
MDLKRCAALAIAVITLGAGCGSASKGGTGTVNSSSTPTSRAAGTGAYRAAVNKVFDEVVAARREYQAAHGDAALGRSALAIERADEAGLSRLHRLDVPTSAKALQAQLTASLAAQAAAMKAVLAASELDTAKLGDAVLMSDDTERIVDQINALP